MRGHTLYEIKKSVDDGKKNSERTLSQQIDYSFQILVGINSYIREHKEMPAEEKELIIAEKNRRIEFLYKHCHVKSIKELNEFMVKKMQYGEVDPEYIPNYTPMLSSARITTLQRNTPLQQENVLLNNFYFMEDNPSVEMLNKNKDKYNKSYIFIKKPPGLLYITTALDKDTKELTVKPLTLKIGNLDAYNKLLSDVKLTNDQAFQYSIPKEKIKQFKKIITDNKGHTLRGRYNLKRLAKNAALFEQGKVMAVNKKSREKDKDHKTSMYTSSERAPARVTIHEGKFYNADAKLMDTSSMISHDKNGIAAFVINDHGELTVFNHFFMRQYDTNWQRTDVVAHSSWNEGRSVIGAGEIEIKNGELVSLSSHSGHYHPDLYNMYEVLKIFQQAGVNIAVDLEAHYIDSSGQEEDAVFGGDDIVQALDQSGKEIQLVEYILRTGQNKISFLEERENELKTMLETNKIIPQIELCKSLFASMQALNDENMKNLQSGKIPDFFVSTAVVADEAKKFIQAANSSRRMIEELRDLTREQKKEGQISSFMSELSPSKSEQKLESKIESELKSPLESTTELTPEQESAKPTSESNHIIEPLTEEETKALESYENEIYNQIELLLHSEYWDESPLLEEAKSRIVQLIMNELPLENKLSGMEKEAEVLSSEVREDFQDKIVYLLSALDAIQRVKNGKYNAAQLLRELEETTLNVSQIPDNEAKDKVSSQEQKAKTISTEMVETVEKFLLKNSESPRFFKSSPANSSQAPSPVEPSADRNQRRHSNSNR